MNKPYEFGNKVGIAVSGRGNFILGIKSFHGNPYDGHTLDQTVTCLRKLSPETSKIFVDLGYAGHNFKEKGKVFMTKTKKALSKDAETKKCDRANNRSSKEFWAYGQKLP